MLEELLRIQHRHTLPVSSTDFIDNHLITHKMDACLPDMTLPKKPFVDHHGIIPIDMGNALRHLSREKGAPVAPRPSDDAMAAPQYTISRSEDVVFYVGQQRKLYHVSAQSLIRGSAYFRNVLQPPVSSNSSRSPPPMIVDCEESIFEKMLLLMRYGTLEALPAMTEAEIVKLKREADFYGVDYMAAALPKNANASSGHGQHDSSSSSDMSSTSPFSSPNGSPKSVLNTNNHPLTVGSSRRMMSGRYHEGVRLACSTSCQLSELSGFPLELADPSKLVLVSCLDQDRAATYACEYCASGPTASRPVTTPTQWALNFHHRHAFCTACGNVPKMPSKHFTEMFMAAATHYYSTPSPDQARSTKSDAGAAWWVGSDSTCMLRFVTTGMSVADSCRCGEASAEAPTTSATIWAASCFYSHAFCTRCSQPANGPTLLSILLALRYGGSKKGSKSARSSFRMAQS